MTDVTDTPPILDIQGLSIDLPGGGERSAAVRDVSLRVGRGEIVCLVGESGSGKSVMAQSVMGLLPKTLPVRAGCIRLQGEDITHAPPSRWRALRAARMSMVFQEPMTALNPVMTCGDQIDEVLRQHTALNAAARRAKVLGMLREVQLAEPERMVASYPHQLSGGQRQRIVIAMALVLDPVLLIADEPTTALDVTTQAQILRLILALQARHGTGVLFITHDFGIVAEIAHRVVVLHRGEVVEVGDKDAVLRRPQHAVTRMLMASVPTLRTSVLGGCRTWGADGENRPQRADFLPDSPPHSSAMGQEDGEKAAAAADLQPATPKSDSLLDLPADAPVVLKVQDLAKTHVTRRGFGPRRTVQAVKGVSFEIRRGQTLGIVGESGCGKSTLARCIVRLTDPSAGEILLGGDSIAQLSARRLRPLRQRVQIIFQDPYRSLNPRRTVRQALIEGPMNFGMPRAEAQTKAAEWLGRVRMDASALDRYPHQFSGGQRQRLCIARALMLEPELLVADEAVSALDVSVQAQVLALWAEIRQHLQIAMLFITHDLRVASQVCDVLAVMHQGEVVEYGPAHEVFGAPRHAVTRALIDAVPGRRFAFAGPSYSA